VLFKGPAFAAFSGHTLATNFKINALMDISKYLLSTSFQIISRNRGNFYRISDQSDKIIVWLVGFSIAIIALLLSKSNLLIPLSLNYLVALVLIYSFSIVFGILYRICMYLTQLIENRLFINFEGYILNLLNGPKIDRPRQLKETDTYFDILKYFKEDFHLEFDNLPSTENLSPEILHVFKLIVADFYNKLSISLYKALNEEVEQVAQVLKHHFGYSERMIDRLRNLQQPYKFSKRIIWVLNCFAHILFLTTVTVFMSGIILFIIKVIQFKICS